MIGYGAGAWIDARLHTAPWFMLTFLLLGTGAGFVNIFRTINHDADEAEKDDNT
jgi:F0F1-type ATP synthase assembly protein I